MSVSVDERLRMPLINYKDFTSKFFLSMIRDKMDLFSAMKEYTDDEIIYIFTNISISHREILSRYISYPTLRRMRVKYGQRSVRKIMYPRLSFESINGFLQVPADPKEETISFPNLQMWSASNPPPLPPIPYGKEDPIRSSSPEYEDDEDLCPMAIKLSPTPPPAYEHPDTRFSVGLMVPGWRAEQIGDTLESLASYAI